MATGLAASPDLAGLVEENNFRLIRKPYAIAELEQAIAEAS